MAGPFQIFLSYNRRDIADVERLAKALWERGVTLFKDDWYLSPGDHWPSALNRHLDHCDAVVVVIGSNGLGPWQQREVYAAINREVQERASGRKTFRVIPVLLAQGALAHAGLGFVSENIWVEGWDPRAADLIVGATQGTPPAELYDEAHRDPRSLFCPYRGLRVFREEDQAFYFGRETDLERLGAAVNLYPIVAIVGASGSGKSSLARAGLVPRLRRQPDRVWQIAIVDRPGQDPFSALAQALLPLWEPQRCLEWSKNQSYQETRTLADSLRADGASRLRRAVEQIFTEEPGTTDLLLIVDQWEELYTYRPEGASAFIAMLLNAVRERGIQVLLTVRADYWGNILTHYPPLAARLAGESTIHLPALLREGLETVIRKPAERTSLTIDPVLVEALLNDAEDQPGDLPLLEFALRQLWEAQTGRRGALTMHAYENMGRLARSIVTHADGVYARLTPEEREAYAYDALMQASELYKTLAIQKSEYLREGDDLKNKAKNLKTQVLTHFWVEDEKGAYFAIGTDRDDNDESGHVRPLTIRTSNMGHLLNSAILSGDGEEIKCKREAIVSTLFSDEMWSPNGIRTLGKNEIRFRPGSYHNGSVWLWDKYYIALGLEKCGYIDHASRIYATIVADIKRAKRYIEFVRGGEAAEPLLNDKIIDIWDRTNNRENRVEQPPQELQAFTVAAAVAIEHKTGKGLFPCVR